jgi:peptide/nickel transport system ATP-binding protein
MALLTIDDLVVDLPTAAGHARILDRVSLSIPPGSSLGLVGESGSGKSMTALVIMGLLPEGARLSGRIVLEGQVLSPLEDAPMARLRGARMAMIFQEPMTSLNPVMSIGAQVAEGVMRHRGLSRAAAEAVAAAMLDKVGLPAASVAPTRYPHELSGGQRQRVMIAMALAPGPRLLIADEPTTALDVTTQAEVLALIRNLSAELGMGLLLISHDLGIIAQNTAMMSVMYHGRIIERGPTAAVLARLAHPYARGLAAAMPPRDPAQPPPFRLATIPGRVPPAGAPRTPCVFAPRCPLRDAICEQEPPMVQVGPEHAAACHHTERAELAFRAGPPVPRTAARAAGSPLLELLGVTRRFPLARTGLLAPRRHFTAVDDVSLTVHAGESVGLIGGSGSGKTTLARIAMALDAPDEGEVRFAGQALAALPGETRRRLRRRFQVVFQDPYGSLDPRHRIGRIVAEPLVGLLPELDEDQRRARVLAALADVGLDAAALPRYPHEFSGGQRQRIAIARALVTEPDLLIADEPVSALDVSVQAQVLNLLADLRERRGLAYLFITHDLAVVRQITDRLLVIDKGRIVEEGATLEVLRRPAHAYTRALLAALPRIEQRGG